MSKHTPGPWQYRRSSTSSTDYYEIMPAGELGGWKDGRYLSVSGAIDEHDARLIAAAPELLEALKSIAEFWNRDHNEKAISRARLVGACWHAVETAEAAIAKAEVEVMP